MAEYLIEPAVPRLTEHEMRQFVLGVADCQVFTTAHMRNSDFEQVGLVVFMPLLERRKVPGDADRPRQTLDSRMTHAIR